jgi:mevalonate kinase
MTAFTASVPGKIILFGEHAVVYGEPALAFPIFSLQSRTVVNPALQSPSGEINLDAPDIDLSNKVENLDDSHPLKAAILEVLEGRDLLSSPACNIIVNSTIPTGSGLGSGAAVSCSLIRAYSAFLGKRLSDEQVSRKAFEIEKIHHGTPSGIDNTVIAHQKAVYYQKGDPFTFLEIKQPFNILIADSGKPGDTLKAIQAVRQGWEEQPEHFNNIFDEIGLISQNARKVLETGYFQDLGALMNQNHKLLIELGISTPELDLMVETAQKSGALGAKLSGGGLGGHIVVLVDQEVELISQQLIQAGAKSVILEKISGLNPSNSSS